MNDDLIESLLESRKHIVARNSDMLPHDTEGFSDEDWDELLRGCDLTIEFFSEALN
tara:strand:+ start:3317 stop:3484 length:168 start_codon:yes stop_codon:yes gene_type:complete